jgi:hypothetical protein
MFESNEKVYNFSYINPVFWTKRLIHNIVDFRFSALSCFEASVAMQKQSDAFCGAGGKPPRSLSRSAGSHLSR